MCKKESQTLQIYQRTSVRTDMKKHWAYLVIGHRLFDRWFDVALCRCGYKSSGRKGTASECLQSASGRHDVRRGWRSASGSLPNGKNKNADVERWPSSAVKQRLFVMMVSRLLEGQQPRSLNVLFPNNPFPLQIDAIAGVGGGTGLQTCSLWELFLSTILRFL